MAHAARPSVAVVTAVVVAVPRVGVGAGRLVPRTLTLTASSHASPGLVGGCDRPRCQMWAEVEVLGLRRPVCRQVAPR